MATLKNNIVVNASVKDDASPAFKRMAGNADDALGDGPKGIAGLGISAGAAVAAIGASALAAGGFLLHLGTKAAAAGDRFEKMSKRTGVAAEELSTLEFAAERSGTTLDVVEKSLARLARNARDASEGTGEAKVSFEKLGIELETADGLLRPTEDILLDIADAMGDLDSDTSRAAEAQILLGRSGVQMLPLLLEGKEGIAGLQEQARTLGLQFSTTESVQGAAFEDRMTDLKGVLGGLGRTVGMAFIPAMTSVAEGLTKAILKTRDFVQLLKDVKEETDNISPELKKLAEELGVDNSKGLFPAFDSATDSVAGFDGSLNDVENNILGVKKRTVELSDEVITFASAESDATGAVGDFRAEIRDAEENTEDLAVTTEDATDELGNMKDAVEGLNRPSAIPAWGEGLEDVDALMVNLVDSIDATATSMNDKLAPSLSTLGTKLSVGITGIDAQQMVASGLGDLLSGRSIENVASRAGQKIGSGLGAAIGGPIGTVVGGVIGSLAGEATKMIAGLFGKGKDEFKAAAVAEEVVRSVREGGGVGTADFDLREVGFGGLQVALEDLGFSRSEANVIAGKVLTRQSFGESGQAINRMVEDLAVRQELDKRQRGRKSEGFAERIKTWADTWEDVGPVMEPDPDVRLDKFGNIIPAAGGFSGIVTKPTLFMAGEAGPEQVNVIPADKFVGGGHSGSKTELHFNFSIQAHDRNGVRDFIEGEARDFIADIIREETRRGVGIVDPLGLIADQQV